MNMQTNSHVDSYFINAFHRQNSMAAQREAMRMSLHPCSREQKLAQIQSLKEKRLATLDIYLSDMHNENVIKRSNIR